MPTSTRPAPGRFVDRQIVGSKEQLTAYLARQTAAGRLVAVTSPRPASGGNWRVTVRLRQPVTVTPTSEPRPAVSSPRTPSEVAASVRPPLTSVPGAVAVARPADPDRTFRRVFLTVTAVLVAIGVTGLVVLVLDLAGFLARYGTTVLGVIAGAVVICLIVRLGASRRGSGRHCPGCPD